MAIKFEIQVRNGKVTMTVGGAASNTKNGGGTPNTRNGGGAANTSGRGGDSSPWDNGGTGGSSPWDNDGTGGGQPGAGGGYPFGTTVIGPIILDGSAIQGQDELGGSSPFDNDGTGGSSPFDNDGTGGSSPFDNDGTGGRGPLSTVGSGYGTTIIGPIIFAGSYSGQGAASSGSAADLAVSKTAVSKAVTVNPPPLAAKSLTTPLSTFAIQPQEGDYLCWAAVAVSINAFLTPPTKWTQGTVVAKLLNNPACSLSPGTTDECDKPQALDAALTITGNLRKDGYLTNKHLAFECIQKWIGQQLPVGARITWFGKGNGAHFIALTACKVLPSGQQLVYVQDPDQTTASNSPGFVDYEELRDAYGAAGYWSDTYLVIA